MGWDANTSLSAIDGVVQLAAASEMDLAQASDMVTDYLSAFGMEASRAGEMADMLSYAQANSNTTVAQLGEAYGNCAAGMHSAGQEIDTVTALLEGMANNGLKGSEAGTALNAVMAQITQKMKAGAIQIGETSVAVKDQDGNFRDLVDIMEDVEDATAGMGTAERSAALAAVFNRTSLVGVNQILNEGTDKIKKYREELNKSKGSAEEMAGVMQDNLQGDLTEMNSALEGLGIAAYDAFSDKLRDGVQMATDVVSGLTKAISNTTTPLQDFIQNIDDGNRRVKESMDSAKGAFNSAETDAAKLDVYKQALLDVADATETTEFQKFQISQIVEELGGEIPELTDAWDAEAGKLNLTAEAIENLMTAYESASLQRSYVDALTKAQQALNDATVQRAMADSAVAQAEQDLVKIGEDEKTLWRDGLTATQEYNDAVGDLRDTRMDALTAQSDAIKQEEEAQAQYDATVAALDELKKKYPGMADEAEDVADAEEEAAKGALDLSQAVETIDPERMEALQKAAEDTRTSIQSAMRGAVDAFNEFNGGAEVTTDEIINNLDSQIEGLESWSENMEKLGQQAGDGMSQELYDKLAEMGPQSANLVQTLVDALENDTDSFAEISEKWSQALDLSDNSEQIANATSAGKTLAEAQAQGILDAQQELLNSVDENTAAAITAINEKQSEFNTCGTDSMKKMAEGMSSSSGQARTAGSDVAVAGVAGAMSQYSGFYSAGRDAGGGMVAGIASQSSRIEAAARNAARKAYNAARQELEAHSPSKKTERGVGIPFAEGIAAGIEKGTPLVVSASESLANSASAAANKAVKKSTKKTAEEAYNEAKKWIAKNDKELKDEVKKNAKADSKEDKALSAKISKNFGVSDTKTEGSGKNKKTVKKSASELSADIYSAADKYLANYSTLHDISEKQELKYWQGVQKRLKKGSQAWYDAQKKINQAEEEIAEAERKTAEARVEAYEQKQEAKAQAAIDKRKTLARVQDDILADYKVYYKTSNKAEMEYWNAARKQFKKGTQERIDADAKYYASRQEYLDELNELNEDYAARSKEINDNLLQQTEELQKAEAEKLKEINASYDDAIQSRKQDILQSQNLFEAWDSTGYTAETLLHNLKTQTEGLKLWEKEMNVLRSKALPQELVDQLEEMGPDATASIYSLNRMTSKQLDEYVSMWNEKNAIAQRQAEAENEKLKKERDQEIADTKADTQNQINAIKAESNKQLKELNDEYQKTFKEINAGASTELLKLVKNAKKTGENSVAGLIAGLDSKKKEAKKKGEDVGEKIGEGIAAGLKEQIKTAEKEATNYIKTIQAAMKAAAQIHSPSALFRDKIGAQIAAGVALGMDEGTTEVRGSASDLISSALDAAEKAQEPISWEAKGLAGIRSLNALMAPQTISQQASQAADVTGLLTTLVALVGAISEKDMNVTLDSGELVGALTPGISREMAATSIRNTRGRYA